MHCRACQKWLFLAASQWFISSFISCLATISRVLSNPGRLDTLLFWFFSSLLEFFASLLLCNCLVTSGICVRSRCAAQPELSASVKGGLYCLFIFVLRVLCGVTDVVCFFGFFCLLLSTHLLSWPTLLYFWNNWKEKEGEMTDKEKKKSWEMYLEKKIAQGWREIFFYETVKKTVY